jgi:curli production assembly/transport component CsgG
VNVQTGEVVITTTIEKTIVSTSVVFLIFKYFDTDTMLVEVEAGYARNEPVTFALRKAIEKGVVDLIHLGAKKELWQFDIEEITIPEVKDYIPNETKVHTDIETQAEEVTNENNDENVDTSDKSATN